LHVTRLVVGVIVAAARIALPQRQLRLDDHSTALTYGRSGLQTRYVRYAGQLA
jgi:hypothetical protein